jgi:glucuronoxylan 4-O-methyltransferase
MEFYNSKIQLDKKVIDDVFSNLKNDTKMLVFGLGYDSKMWYEGNNKNTYFIENKKEYIDLNLNDIPMNNIINYQYNTSVEKSFKLTDNEIIKYEIPDKLKKLSPFDIIIIDGPEGYSNQTPGRLIPCYWATLLSKKGTIIYIDDSRRHLENYCINKYFQDKEKQIFNERDGCVKCFI